MNDVLCIGIEATTSFLGGEFVDKDVFTVVSAD
jgi:hypothetical protein